MKPLLNALYEQLGCLALYIVAFPAGIVLAEVQNLDFPLNLPKIIRHVGKFFYESKDPTYQPPLSLDFTYPDFFLHARLLAPSQYGGLRVLLVLLPHDPPIFEDIIEEFTQQLSSSPYW
ncbi:MAG: hypothetical protein EU536_00180 [Promethearchaeota archaeon]|nr:MAG: hypothetical protein EU536_00180 [Candidatus Lokiarchaeota archaeon]